MLLQSLFSTAKLCAMMLFGKAKSYEVFLSIVAKAPDRYLGMAEGENVEVSKSRANTGSEGQQDKYSVVTHHRRQSNDFEVPIRCPICKC